MLKNLFFQLMDIFRSIFIFGLLYIYVKFELWEIRVVESIIFGYCPFDILA